VAAPLAGLLLLLVLAPAGRMALAQDNGPLAGATPPQAEQVALRPDQVALVERTLEQAETQGFPHAAFTAPGVDALLQSRNPDVRRQGEAQLIAALLRYAHDVHSGRLAPGDFLHDWGLHPAAYDPAPEFAQAVTQDRLEPWLDSLPPPYTGYDTLKQGLALYRGIAARGGWQALTAAPLTDGMRGPGVVALRARLAIEDPAVAAGGDLYDAALEQAVTRAQKRYGFDPTGELDKPTIAALNVPVGQRVEQILANMERWRWLPRQLPADRIQVNIAAAILTVFHDDTPTLAMRAVTGRPGDETPMLSSIISDVLFNPPWNVPSDIAAKELWPKEHAHPGYFARNEFVVIHTPNGGVRLQQKAGDMSALGHVKFEFPNPYSVYLHDTPSHSTFGRYARMVSHGCVRLEKPVVLADAVMQGDAKWTPDAINDAIASGDTIRAPIPKPISVFLLYWTAFGNADGSVSFRADPYDWDRALMQRIDAAQHPVT
jgi:murein L,D-transpeptidase YcbB/YkuD